MNIVSGCGTLCASQLWEELQRLQGNQQALNREHSPQTAVMSNASFAARQHCCEETPVAIRAEHRCSREWAPHQHLQRNHLPLDSWRCVGCQQGSMYGGVTPSKSSSPSHRPPAVCFSHGHQREADHYELQSMLMN
jgi:hypothetical protein